MPSPEPENADLPAEHSPPPSSAEWTGLRASGRVGSSITPTEVESNSIESQPPAEAFGFQLIQTGDIPDLKGTGYIYRHEILGTEVLFLKNDNPVKGIGIEFVNPSENSSGVDHFVEHDTFRGCLKYPSQDPVNEYERGSVCLEVNAMTGPDWTLYYANSEHPQDFQTLCELLLNSCFFALHRPETAKQELRRLEWDKKEKRIVFSGIILNEMWDWHGDPDECHVLAMRRALFPGSIYSHNSGGDPLEILKLTHEEMVRVARKVKVPANAKIVFAGDCNIKACLRHVYETLQGLDPGRRIQLPSDTPTISAPQRIEDVYPGAEDENRARDSHITINWAMASTGDIMLNYKLAFLHRLLLGERFGVLRRYLEENKFGESIFESEFDDDLSISTFTVGVTGASAGDSEKFETAILNQLREIMVTGFSPELISDVVLSFRHEQEEEIISPQSAYDSLSPALEGWRRGSDPIESIKERDVFQRLCDELIECPRLFEELVGDYLLNNPRRVTLTLRPDRKLLEHWEAAQQQILDEYCKQLGPDGVARELKESEALADRVGSADTLSALGRIFRLNVTHMKRRGVEVPVELSPTAPWVSHSALQTGNLAYFELAYDLRSIPDELLPYAALFGECVLRTPHGVERDALAIIHNPRVTPSVFHQDGGKSVLPVVRFQGAALREHFVLALERLEHRFVAAQLDQRKFVLNCIQASRERLTGEIRSMEAVFAEGRAEGLLSVAANIRDRLRGLQYFSFLDRIEREVRAGSWTPVRDRLAEVRELLTKKSNCLAHLVCDDSSGEFMECLGKIGGLRANQVLTIAETHRVPADAGLGIVMPNMVNNIGMAVPLRRSQGRVGSDAVIAWHISNTELWEKVRKGGGAYGSMASIDSGGSIFLLSSRSDSKILPTIETFCKLPTRIRELARRRDQIRQSIITQIGLLDQPRPPGEGGREAFESLLEGEAAETRQRFREEVLGTRPKDYRRFAKELEDGLAEAKIVIIGNRRRLLRVQDALHLASVEAP